jgi:hypothetical protein
MESQKAILWWRAVSYGVQFMVFTFAAIFTDG